MLDSSEAFYKSLYKELKLTTPREVELTNLKKELKLSNLMLMAFLKHLL